MSTPTNRVLSGMRPTGRLHIGHYFGALQNWVRLQNEQLPSGEAADSSSPLATRHSPLPAYECFYFVADWHALTSDYADTSAIAQNSLDITIDFLASGLDPAKSTIFLQSQVPEHAELHLLLSMVTPLGWLERIPTYKEQLDNIQNKDLHTYGFLGYPTLQTADIVMYSAQGKGLLVPVGEDQVSHVEFSRELVRRCNFFYGFEIKEDFFIQANWGDYCAVLKELGVVGTLRDIVDVSPNIEARNAIKSSMRARVTEMGVDNFFREVGPNAKYFDFKEILTEPAALLTPTPRIPGLDGRKMSKSYNNAITLSETDNEIRAKTKVMKTDPARQRRTDKGDPDKCPVYDWHKLFSTPERDPGRLDWVRTGCTTAGIGCIECKSAMAENLIKWIAPVRERRVHFENDQKSVLKILDEGSAKARESAKLTMQRVRDAIFNWPRKRRDLSSL